MAAKFELFKDKAGEYRWRLRHQNGNVIADSGEGYTTKSAALDGIESVKKNISTAVIKDTSIPQVLSKPGVPSAETRPTGVVDDLDQHAEGNAESKVPVAQISQVNPANDINAKTEEGRISETKISPIMENQPAMASGNVPGARTRETTAVSAAPEKSRTAVNKPVSVNKEFRDSDVTVIVAVIMAVAFLVLAAGIIFLQR
jgi:uncharacterized protein